MRLGCDHLVKMADCGMVLALGGNHDAEVMRDNCMAGRNFQRSAIGRFCLTKTSGLVMRYRVRDKLVEFTLGSSRHVTLTFSTRIQSGKLEGALRSTKKSHDAESILIAPREETSIHPR